MRHKQMSIAIGVALGLASSVALAQQPERGFYGGLSLGPSIVSFDDANVGGSVTKDETDAAWKLFAGYRIHRNVAIEGGYTDFGKFSITRAVFGSSASTSIKVSGFHLEGVGIIPIRNFSIFLKAGTVYATTETSTSVTGPFFRVIGNPNREESEFNLKLGIGGAWDFHRNWALRVEYEQVFKVGDTGGDVGMLSVGGVYKF